MAIVGPFTNGYVSVNWANLSDHVSEVTLDITLADVPVTAMGAGGVQRMMGLEDSKFEITFWQDEATASSVGAVLWACRTAGTAVPVKIAESGASFGTANPTWSGNCILTDYPPISGKVGDALSTKATFVVSGTVTKGTA